MITIYCGANIPPHINPEWVRHLRPLWAAEECGVPYQMHELDTPKGEQRGDAYRAVNPFGIIPGMTDGDFKLFESGAMVAYICDKAGKHIPAPRTKERALYDQWCFAALNTIEPQVFQHMIAVALNKEAAWAIDGRAYLLGDEFSGADILMGHVLNFIADPALLDAAPNVKAYHSRVKARPAYARALSARTGGKNAAVAAR